MSNTAIAIFWHRRDLRLHDNTGLYHALQGPLPVLPLFIFDTDILDALPSRKDARVAFIHSALGELRDALAQHGSSLLIRHGKPVEVWQSLLAEYTIGAVYTNRDYEPYAHQRDQAVEMLLSGQNIPFHTYKDHVIFEKEEVRKDDGTPYTVFTPYSRKWRTRLDSAHDPDGESLFLKSWPTADFANNLFETEPLPYPALNDLGFEPAGIPFPPATVSRGLIRMYDQTRNFPAISGTSRLGVHFRFGTISIREKALHARSLNDTFLNELIWRDFYSQILAHFPHVAERAFKPAYDRVPWRDAPRELERWKNGATGYPIVDAGMRELNATGFMHNRVRMITASFLTKHLLIDWRLGEAYFAEKLLDYDLASNAGGWQWAAGCGTDAAPYFRIFNPAEQARKFDPKNEYIRKWVPEWGTARYPEPVVEHKFARERCLDVYKAALG
ncbi:MAG: deoxyribodipyrimidine photo-lyase [Saprospiraceae bacterium]|nr:deoxyribodipyrimidine photo-lyase [Saprospiraceae bacterium]